METNKENSLLIRNLTDAGCGKAMISELLELRSCGNRPGEMDLLSRQRQILLKRVHTDQRKLDRLDFLINSLNRENVSNLKGSI